jgi:hypothetical protein
MSIDSIASSTPISLSTGTADAVEISVMRTKTKSGKHVILLMDITKLFYHPDSRMETSEKIALNGQMEFVANFVILSVAP